MGKIALIFPEWDATLIEGEEGKIAEADVLGALYQEFGTVDEITERADRETAATMGETMEEIAEHIAHGAHGDTIQEALDYLGLDILREPAPEPEAARDYNRHLSEEHAQEITRSSETRAMTLTGEMGAPTELVRLAYIKRARGRGAAAAAERAAEEAKKRGGENAARKSVAADFLSAYRQARERWEVEHADLRTGRRMAGPIFLAMRKALGYSQEKAASCLEVSRETVRDWEAGKAPIPVGVTSEMWERWEAHVGALRSHVERGQIPGDLPCEEIQQILLMRGVRRTNVDPGPQTVYYSM